MNATRRSFLKTGCLSGLCACGFLRPVEAATAASEEAPKTVRDPLPSRWMAALLPRLEKEMDRAALRGMLRGCAEAHYAHLDMPTQLRPYLGRLEPFLGFLSAEWGWKINYDKAAGVIRIDEGKPRCICPLRHPDVPLRSESLCDCSEGFAEKMFSMVTGTSVRAEVTASILRGAKTCRYTIWLRP